MILCKNLLYSIYISLFLFNVNKISIYYIVFEVYIIYDKILNYAVKITILIYYF